MLTVLIFGSVPLPCTMTVKLNLSWSNNSWLMKSLSWKQQRVQIHRVNKSQSVHRSNSSALLFYYLLHVPPPFTLNGGVSGCVFLEVHLIWTGAVLPAVKSMEVYWQSWPRSVQRYAWCESKGGLSSSEGWGLALHCVFHLLCHFPSLFPRRSLNCRLNVLKYLEMYN